MLEHLPELNESMIQAVLQYVKLGYKPIPLLQWAKRAAIKWGPYQARAPSEAEVRAWFGRGEPNITLLTGNHLGSQDPQP